ncbi:MAG: hypothetical protein R2799_10165 [Crocinitomicaceae bacterium]
MKNILLSTMALALVFASCKKDNNNNNPTTPQLQFKVVFDGTLPRLDNFGNPATVPAGNAAQTPTMRQTSIHYIELASDSLTALGGGEIVYMGTETTAGGANAVNFDQAIKATNGETFLSMNLSQLAPGTYNWIRVSVTYQKYDIQYRFNYPPYINNQDFTGTLASFVGYNNYITTHTVQDSVVTVNANKVQGYWAFETSVDYAGFVYGSVDEGDGAGVTVVNPIFTSSPVPNGSCVITGKLAQPLVITGNETGNVKIVLAFSINNSFEWQDNTADGKFEPAAGETVVDMGLRGLHPYVE